MADFNPTEADEVQLQGSASYRLEVSGVNTNLYIDKPGTEPDELIAIFRNITTLDLNSSSFLYISAFGTCKEGTEENDIITLTDNSDCYNGLGGDDDISGKWGDDDLSGDEGNDTLYGDEGNDRLYGGDGDDRLNPGLGKDEVYGGSGPFGEWYDDDLATDTLVIDYTNANGGMVYTIPQNPETALTYLFANTDEGWEDAAHSVGYHGIEKFDITGSQFNDELRGDTKNDTLRGGEGNDSLTGDKGNDSLDGGGGTDLIKESDNVNFTLTDIQLTGLGTDTLDSIEQAELTGGDGDNTLDASAFTKGSVILDGGKGSDTLKGGSKNDTLTGGNGNDSLVGGAGNDILTGGKGDDTLDGGSGTNRIMESGNVNFTLTDTQLTGTGEFGTDTLSNIQRASLTGGDSANNLDASQFTLGSVTLDGGAGNDNLKGGSKNDTLIGGIGNDSLAGGSGNDILTGGENNDRFVYNTKAPFKTQDIGVDTITDFTPGSDKVVLDKTTFTSLASKAGSGFSIPSEFAVVATNNAAQKSKAFIVYNQTNGYLFYNPNGVQDGFGDGGQFADLSDGLVLGANAFSVQA